MDLIKMYSDLIITPLEKEVKKLRVKVYSKKISFTRKADKEYLNKLENLLFEYYEKFSIFVDEEIDFCNKTNKNT
ncbi:MAG: hypothetical protein MR598_01650 [Erysipelotrichaceae bacterium]|nr:hypothetical protein [Erysipelotrichaceae bacterium]